MVQGEVDHQDAALPQTLVEDAQARKEAAQQEKANILDEMKDGRCCGCIILTVGLRWICVILGIVGIIGSIDMIDILFLLSGDSSSYGTSYENIHGVSANTLSVFIEIHLIFCVLVLIDCLYGLYYLVWGNCEIDQLSMNQTKKAGIKRFGQLFSLYYIYLLFHFIFGTIIEYYTYYDSVIACMICVTTLFIWQRNIKQFLSLLERYAIQEFICVECETELGQLNKLMGNNNGIDDRNENGNGNGNGNGQSIGKKKNKSKNSNNKKKVRNKNKNDKNSKNKEKRGYQRLNSPSKMKNMKNGNENGNEKEKEKENENENENNKEISEKILSVALMIHKEMKQEQINEKIVKNTKEGEIDNAIDKDNDYQNGNKSKDENESGDSTPPPAFALVVSNE